MDRTPPGAGDPDRATAASAACPGADGRAGTVNKAVSKGSSALFLGCQQGGVKIMSFNCWGDLLSPT